MEAPSPNGQARLKSPGSIPVLTNRKYLPIVDKKCTLDRLGRSNRARPIVTHAHCMMHPILHFLWVEWVHMGLIYKQVCTAFTLLITQ